MARKEPEITEVTKRFNAVVENLISEGFADSYKSIAEAIKMNEGDMSQARKGKLNVASKYVKSLEETYNVKIIVAYRDQLIQEIMQDMLYIKASEKIQGMRIAELAAKINKTSFTDEAMSLEKNVAEEVDRLYKKLNKKQNQV